LADYSDHEQAEKLAAWWKQYGPSAIAGVAIGLGLLFGYRYWTQYQEQHRVDASALYEQMLVARAQKPVEATGIAKKLMENYSGTSYAGMAALTLARQQYEAGDRAAARAALSWAVANAKGATLHAARLRLARLHLETGELDAAQMLVEIKNMGGFEPEYYELRGDLLLARERRVEARDAYREAVRRTPADSSYLRLLRMKLDDLGSEESP
jgi:predicted negative regulator of RcsB-dependent stress response